MRRLFESVVLVSVVLGLGATAAGASDAPDAIRSDLFAPQAPITPFGTTANGVVFVVNAASEPKISTHAGEVLIQRQVPLLLARGIAEGTRGRRIDRSYEPKTRMGRVVKPVLLDLVLNEINALRVFDRALKAGVPPFKAAIRFANAWDKARKAMDDSFSAALNRLPDREQKLLIRMVREAGYLR